MRTLQQWSCVRSGVSLVMFVSSSVQFGTMRTLFLLLVHAVNSIDAQNIFHASSSDLATTTTENRDLDKQEEGQDEPKASSKYQSSTSSDNNEAMSNGGDFMDYQPVKSAIIIFCCAIFAAMVLMGISFIFRVKPQPEEESLPIRILPFSVSNDRLDNDVSIVDGGEDNQPKNHLQAELKKKKKWKKHKSSKKERKHKRSKMKKKHRKKSKQRKYSKSDTTNVDCSTSSRSSYCSDSSINNNTVDDDTESVTISWDLDEEIGLFGDSHKSPQEKMKNSNPSPKMASQLWQSSSIPKPTNHGDIIVDQDTHGVPRTDKTMEGAAIANQDSPSNNTMLPSLRQSQHDSDNYGEKCTHSTDVPTIAHRTKGSHLWEPSMIPYNCSANDSLSDN